MSRRYKYEPIHNQAYWNGRWIESGIVRGHEVDTVYLAFGDEPGKEKLRVLLAWDEVATLVWALGGALYSAMMDLPKGADVNPRLKDFGHEEWGP